MIHISDLQIRFKDETVFKNFDLQIKPGENIAISGESGKGKSTLLHLLAGFIPDFSGNVMINTLELCPENIQEIRRQVAWLPQETFLKMPTVKELFFAPFYFTHNKKQKPNSKQYKELFNRFNLPKDILNKKSKEISGGQKQRLLLAACLLLDKPILLLDEPTSALDQKIKQTITDYVLEHKNMTILSATHDAYWINQSDRIIHL